MRLIDADALLAAYDSQHHGEPGKARKLIENAPTVEAVPLDKLCEWLAENALDITQRNVTPMKTSDEHWKRVLAKWMEGLDAQ